jgi:hypothetical protein
MTHSELRNDSHGLARRTQMIDTSVFRVHQRGACIADKQCRRVATRYDQLAANYLASSNLPQSEFGCVLISPRP